MVLQPGSRLGAYEVVDLLGAGGMGEVYRARDTRLARDVAIKVLPDAFALDAERLARFTREAQVLASLNHPNIAAIYGFPDTGETGGPVRALVLELVTGETLADRTARGPIPVEEALGIARQIADALQAAHEQGVIHRDLKPANIKVRDDSTVKVLDFGLAKARDPIVTGAGATVSPTITSPVMMTGVGSLLGTAAYMAPEQAKGRPADKRSDIWAFGCVVYEMLTGQRAFPGEDVADTLAAVLRGEPDWAALPADLPPAVQTVLRRCLSRDPRSRVADMAAAQFALSESVGAKAAASTVMTPRRRIRMPLLLAAAALGGGLLVGAAAWVTAPTKPANPVVRFAFGLPATQQFPAASRPFIAISPDATRIAYATTAGLFLRSIGEFDAHPIPGTDPGAHSLAFSPDGRWLVFWYQGSLKRIAVTGGAAITLCEVPAPLGLTWDASGIVVGEGPDGISRCPTSGGRPEPLVKVGRGETAHGPQLLPGGKEILFTLGRVSDGAKRWDLAEIVVQSLASGQRKLLFKGGSDARYVATGHILYAVGGVVSAIPFDPKRLEVKGEPVPVIEGVRRGRGLVTGVAQFATTSTGALVYIPGPVAFTSDQITLATADRAGNVTRLTVPSGAYTHVRASTDAKRIAIGIDDGTRANVFIHELAGTTAMRRLTLDDRSRFPIWSPDGERVAFQSGRDGDLGVFMQRADGTGSIERLTKAGSNESHIPESWSPDGRNVLVSVAKDGVYSLFVVSLVDRKMSPFNGVTSVEPIGPVFSPDGRWVAYTSETAIVGPSASPQTTGGIFVQPFPPTGAVYPAPKVVRDFHVVWSRDGRELIYVPSAVGGRLAIVPVRLQPFPTFGNPQQIPARVTGDRLSGEMRAYDVFPDGRFIGVVPTTSDLGRTANEAPPDEVRVVLNWFDELKQRTDGK